MKKRTKIIGGLFLFSGLIVSFIQFGKKEETECNTFKSKLSLTDQIKYFGMEKQICLNFQSDLGNIYDYKKQYELKTIKANNPNIDLRQKELDMKNQYFLNLKNIVPKLKSQRGVKEYLFELNMAEYYLYELNGNKIDEKTLHYANDLMNYGVNKYNKHVS